MSAHESVITIRLCGDDDDDDDDVKVSFLRGV